MVHILFLSSLYQGQRFFYDGPSCWHPVWSSLIHVASPSSSLELIIINNLLPFIKVVLSKMFYFNINPLTPKILLLILPTCCHIFPYSLVMRNWCYQKQILTDEVESSHYLFSGLIYGYYGEKLHINHFLEIKGWTKIINKWKSHMIILIKWMFFII